MSLQPQSTSLAIVEPQNLQTIVQLGPTAYNDNTLSHTRCLAAGQMLLDRIAAEGMNDALDQEVARFIDKARATVKKMNAKRSPVTKLFDQLRTVFTTLENDVDPTRAGSLPYKLQAERNAYAAKKHAEAEAARRAEMLRQQQEQARARYRADLEEDYKRQVNSAIVRDINTLTDLERSVTLASFDTVKASVEATPTDLDISLLQSYRPAVPMPAELTPDASRCLQAQVLRDILPHLQEQYTFEISTTRQDILDRLPSKRTELERIARADAEEAARIQAQIQQREAQEAQRRESERAERERQERAAAELATQRQEMDSLFGTHTPMAEYIPKTQVKKRIVINSPDDIMAVLSLWWSQEGCTLAIEDLAKMFRKQITFCERLANDKVNPITLTNISYQEEVKAK